MCRNIMDRIDPDYYFKRKMKKRFVVSTGLGAAGVNPFNGKFNVTVGVTASLGIKLFI